MKKILLLVTIHCILLSCSSPQSSKAKERDSGLVFAEKIFDIWKDFSKERRGVKGDEIVINRTKLSRPFSMAVTFLPPQGEKNNWRWTRVRKTNSFLPWIKINLSRAFLS